MRSKRPRVDVTTAAHVWGKQAPLTHDSAVMEIARLEAAIAGWKHEIDTLPHHDDIPRHQMVMRQNMQIGWANTELQTARAALQEFLKE